MKTHKAVQFREGRAAAQPQATPALKTELQAIIARTGSTLRVSDVALSWCGPALHPELAVTVLLDQPDEPAGDVWRAMMAAIRRIVSDAADPTPPTLTHAEVAALQAGLSQLERATPPK